MPTVRVCGAASPGYPVSGVIRHDKEETIAEEAKETVYTRLGRHRGVQTTQAPKRPLSPRIWQVCL